MVRMPLATGLHYPRRYSEGRSWGVCLRPMGWMGMGVRGDSPQYGTALPQEEGFRRRKIARFSRGDEWIIGLEFTMSKVCS